MINTDVPIVFLPMHKSLKQMSGNGKSSSGNCAVEKNIDTQQSITPVKKGTIAAALPEAKSKKRSKKSKVQEQKKKNKTNKKSEQKKVAEPEKKIEEKPKQVEPQKSIDANEQIKTVETPLQNAGTPNADNQNVLYVGQQELDSLQMQDYLQQEMAQHWSPPAGMRENISCVVKVMIGFNGLISGVVIEQSSGVLIFDGAAKRAASQFTPPQWAYGKEIILTFKP